MAYVISVCGAGGKTTFVMNKAYSLSKTNKKVCVLTTTHMFKDTSPFFDIIGKDIEDSCIAYPGDVVYNEICTKYDYVVIEADGSRRLPLKIPNTSREPVIPQNTNEIYCIFSLSALDRKIKAVCHRYTQAVVNKNINENIFNMSESLHEKICNENYKVDYNLIKEMLEHFYTKPLSKKYPKAKVFSHIVDIEKSENYKNYKKIVIAIMASGLSKRFGSNKLLYKLDNGLLVYENIIEIVTEAINKLKKYFKTKFNYEIDIDLSIISQYEEILNDTKYQNVIKIKNDLAVNGQSESIKRAIEYFSTYDAICYTPADIINLDPNELFLFLKNFIFTNKNIACFYTEANTSPTIINKKYYKIANNITGDVGLRQILTKYPADLYVYHILPSDLTDLDIRPM